MVEVEEATNRRAFLTDKLLFPTIAGAVGGGLVQLLAKLLEQNRSLSISILALDDAEIKYGPCFLSPFGPDEPLPIPVPSPSTRFTHVTIFPNDGDFSEENV